MDALPRKISCSPGRRVTPDRMCMAVSVSGESTESTTVSLPAAAKDAPRLRVTVVLPAPALGLVMTMLRASTFCSIASSLAARWP